MRKDEKGFVSAIAAAWSAFKSTWTLDGGGSSFHDGDNFRTNRVTVADYRDSESASGATGLSATYACVTLIGGTVGSIPPAVLRPAAGGVHVEDRKHPLFDLLHGSPNADQSAVDFWDFMACSVELAGNAYAEIERGSGGRILALTPPMAAPQTVKVERREFGRIWYSWDEKGRRREVPQENMLHLRGPGGTSILGASPLALCRATFNGALNAQASASSTFLNGARPSGVLSAPAETRFTAEQRAELEGILQEKFIGAMNSGRPMLLDGGLTWAQLSISPNDAQLLETRKFSVEEICRIFGVPPHMIGHLEKTQTLPGGIEQQTIGFLIFTMRRRVKRYEAALKKQLLTSRDRAEGITIKFDMRELLRGDSKGRSEFYERMTRIGAMTINEVRAEENLPPVQGGDVPRLQMQNVPITEAGVTQPPGSEGA